VNLLKFKKERADSNEPSEEIMVVPEKALVLAGKKKGLTMERGGANSLNKRDSTRKNI